MATFLQLHRRAILQLFDSNEAPAADATTLDGDAFHVKVAEKLNDILEEVEAAAQWRALRQRDTATISANALSASLANANERSRVFQVVDPRHGRLVPLVFDVTNTSAQRALIEMDLSELLYRDQTEDNASSGTQPSHFALSPTAAGMDIYVYPRPTAAVNIEADMIIPQARVDYTDDTSLDTNIKVPNFCVSQGLMSFMYQDRGEELGPRGVMTIEDWRRSLSDAAALEHDQQGLNELVPV